MNLLVSTTSRWFVTMKEIVKVNVDDAQWRAAC